MTTAPGVAGLAGLETLVVLMVPVTSLALLFLVVRSGPRGQGS